MIYAVSAADGTVLWSFDTAQQFETVNRLFAKGGAISVSGAVTVNGMVFVGSGYAVGSGASGGCPPTETRRTLLSRRRTKAPCRFRGYRLRQARRS
jgi:hypothetical protein